MRATSVLQTRLDEAIARYKAAECTEQFAAALNDLHTIRAASETATTWAPVDGQLQEVPDEPLDFSSLPEADFLELLCGEPITITVAPVPQRTMKSASASSTQHDAEAA